MGGGARGLDLVIFFYKESQSFDHFDLHLTPVTLTFSLPEKMFQMALFLLKDNNCAKLFLNSCIKAQVIARTSSIYGNFELYLTPVPLTFNLPKKCFKWHFSSRGQQLCKIIF